MDQVLSIMFAVGLGVLTLVLATVGIYLVLVLREFRRTMQKINNTLDEAEQKISHLVVPLKNLGGIAAGVKTGVKVFEGFVGWLNKNKKSDE